MPNVSSSISPSGSVTSSGALLPETGPPENALKAAQNRSSQRPGVTADHLGHPTVPPEGSTVVVRSLSLAVVASTAVLATSACSPTASAGAAAAPAPVSSAWFNTG